MSAIMEDLDCVFSKMTNVIKIADELHEEATPVRTLNVRTLNAPTEYVISADVLYRLGIAQRELLKTVRKAREE